MCVHTDKYAKTCTDIYVHTDKYAKAISMFSVVSLTEVVAIYNLQSLACGCSGQSGYEMGRRVLGGSC